MTKERNSNAEGQNIIMLCSPNVEKGGNFVNFTVKRGRKNEICTLFVSSADERKYS